MLTDIFTRTSVLTKLEAGPFGPFLSDLVTALRQQRYATDTIQKYLHSADAFGRWVKTQQIPLSAIDEDTVVRYVSSLKRRKVRSCPHGVPPHEAVGLEHLLCLLRRQNIIPPPQPVTAATPGEQLLAEYDQYLERTAGAAVGTRHKYLYFARQLLTFAFGSATPDWSLLQAETIAAFVQKETAPRRGAGRKLPGSATRIFLRYLVTRGLISTGPEAAIPGARISGTAEIRVKIGHRLEPQARMRRTEVLPMPVLRAISALLNPFANNFFTSFSFLDAEGGRPSTLPSARA